MNENTTTPATEFDLLPCSICGKQPELVEEPRYFFSCHCSLSSGLEYPSVSLAAEKWNSMNDLSNFAHLHDDGWAPCSGEPTDDDISPSRKLHGYREFSSVPGLLARLKSCPFCGAQPEILECPNPSDYGYFVRCLCCTADTFAETILQRTPDEAIAAWNTRAADMKPPLFQPHRHIPVLIFLVGGLLVSFGAGLSIGFDGFLYALGLFATVSGLHLLPDKI